LTFGHAPWDHRTGSAGHCRMGVPTGAGLRHRRRSADPGIAL
jgi:hypothetical protein